MEKAIQNLFEKDEATSLERLNYSAKGDEIIIKYSSSQMADEYGRAYDKYKTFIAIDDAKFREAYVEKNELNGEKTIAIRLKNQDMTSDQVLEDCKKHENWRPFWNRKKFHSNEIDELLKGKTIRNYDEINNSYNPQKRIADMQLIIASSLQNVTACSEINYYKYKDGKRAGIDSYVCTGDYGKEFLKLQKNTVYSENQTVRKVKADLEYKFTVWDIANTLPKEEYALSPQNDINIRCKWNKYTREEMTALKSGEILNDTEIEARREKYVQSNHYFVPRENEGGNIYSYTECWVDKETESKLLYTRDVQLSREKIAEYQDKGKIKRPEEIPGLESSKQKEINVRKPSQALER